MKVVTVYMKFFFFFLKLYIFEDLLIFECLILELYSKYNF